MGYTACFTWSTSCDKTFEIDFMKSRLKNADLSKCIDHCNMDTNCKFAFLQHENDNTCIKYSACEIFRPTTYFGTTYSKDNSCPGDNIKIWTQTNLVFYQNICAYVLQACQHITIHFNLTTIHTCHKAGCRKVFFPLKGILFGCCGDAWWNFENILA